MTPNISSYSPIVPVHSPCSPSSSPNTPSPSSTSTHHHLTPQRPQRRKVPCMDLIQGTQMAAELAKKAMALIVCCLMLTMGSKQVTRTASSTASCSPQSSCPSSGASSPKRKSESIPHSAAFSPQAHTQYSFNSSSSTNSTHSQHSTSSNSTHQRKTVPPIGKGTFDSSINRPSYYETLLVSSVASGAEIKASHRRLAIRYHPDKVSQRVDKSGRPSLSAAQCQAMFIRVQEAYEVLSDPEERRRYDMALATQTRYRKMGKGASNGDDANSEPYSASTNPSYSPFSTSSNASYGSPSPMPSSVNASRRTSWDSSFPGWKNATAPRPSRLNSLLRCIYIAVPLALFKVFVMRPLAALAPRLVDALPNYIARGRTAVKKRVHAVLSIPSSFRRWLSVTYSFLTQWTWLQLFSWSLSLMMFSTLYVPLYCVRRWRQVKRTIFNLINGENVQEEDEWPVWMDRFKPPTPVAHPPVAATTKTRSSIPIRVQSKSDSSDPSVASTASESSDASTPSLSASASASSMSSTDGSTPRHSTVTLAATAKARSLSESEYEGSDEEWGVQDLTPVSHSLHHNGAAFNSEGMKKSRSMPFTAHQRDYN